MKKALYFVLLSFTFLFILTGCKTKKNVDIISTCFAGYDFAKGIAKDKLECDMLLEPGEELHDYSPSVGDIERILNSKIFIYIGGESDSEWVEKQILPQIKKDKITIINMMDVLEDNLYYEEDPEENETEDEYDEHVWTSITNAKILVNSIYEEIVKIDSENTSFYTTNKDNYISELDKIDSNIKEVINSTTKRLLVFADRFPLLYFIKEYNLEYDAACSGCESAKEANPKTIERLIKKVKDNDLKVIFVIELSESKIADTIISDLKGNGITVSKKTFYSMHNVSKDDYKNGLTYIDYMNMNIESLKEALK